MENRYYVLDSDGVQIHGPYKNKKQAIIDAGKTQANTGKIHTVSRSQLY